MKIGHPTTIGWVITVQDWAQIRYLHGSEGMSVRAIAARLGLSRDTVSRAVKSNSPPKYVRVSGPSALDAFEGPVRRLLAEFPPVLASGGGGALYTDTLKNNRARTVPLVADLVLIVDRWSSGKSPGDWLFEAPRGWPVRESNWKRSVAWSSATAAVGLQGFRLHDLRHTAASVWLGAGADPKVVQRMLGRATAAMTMDLYGHLVDDNLWDAARPIGGILGASEPTGEQEEDENEAEPDESAWL